MKIFCMLIYRKNISLIGCMYMIYNVFLVDFIDIFLNLCIIVNIFVPFSYLPTLRLFLHSSFLFCLIRFLVKVFLLFSITIKSPFFI